MRIFSTFILAATLSALWLFLAVGASRVSAHEDIAVQVRDLTERLAADPADTVARHRRADLYIRHGDWDLARKDLAVLRESEGDEATLRLLAARIDLGEQRVEACLDQLDRLIAEDPTLPAPHFYRGRALLIKERNREAAKAFSKGIDLLETPRPEHYFERAQALASDPHSLRQAIESLDAGLARLTDNMSLEQYALQLEREAGMAAEALHRIDRVLSVHGRLPQWLIAKGEILTERGRRREAAAAFNEALQTIARLPARRRATSAMQELAQQAGLGLDSVRSDS